MKRTFAILLLLTTATHAANEINAFCPGVTTAYAVVRQGDGDVWYVTGQAFEAWGTGGRTAADYDIALTDKGGDMFVGDFDTNIAAGSYTVVTHYQAGAGPADTDPVVWIQEGDWSGSAFATANTPSAIALAVRGEMDANSVRLVAIQAMTDLLAIVTTTVATVTDANEFTLTAGQDVNDAYWMNALMVQDANDSHAEVRWIETYVTSRSVTLDRPLSFTPAPGDKAWILGPVYGSFLDRLVDMLQAAQSPIYYFHAGGSNATGGAGGTTYYDTSGDDP